MPLTYGAGHAARASIARKPASVSGTGLPRILLDRSAGAAMPSACSGTRPNALRPGMASSASVRRTQATPSSIVAAGSPVRRAAASAYRARAG